MKIAVPSTGSTLEAPVDDRFGRAHYFCIVTLEDQSITGCESVDNSDNIDAAHGAGSGAAELVAESGADTLLAPYVGPSAFAGLDAANIAVYPLKGETVKDAVETFLKESPARIENPSGPGHHGAL